MSSKHGQTNGTVQLQNDQNFSQPYTQTKSCLQLSKTQKNRISEPEAGYQDGPFIKQRSQLMMVMWKIMSLLRKNSRKGIPSTIKHFQTEMKICLEKKDEGMNLTIRELCQLCTHEQFQILLNPQVATLNQKTEKCQTNFFDW